MAVDWGWSSDRPGVLVGHRRVRLPSHGCHQRPQDEICSPQGLLQWNRHSWVPQVEGAVVCLTPPTHKWKWDFRLVGLILCRSSPQGSVCGPRLDRHGGRWSLAQDQHCGTLGRKRRRGEWVDGEPGWPSGLRLSQIWRVTGWRPLLAHVSCQSILDQTFSNLIIL